MGAVEEQATTRASGPGETRPTEVFISYSRRDSDLVRELVDMLEERGRSCWVDWKGIPPSAEWMREVTAAIDRAEALVFVLSPDSAASEVCREELDRATEVNKRIVPIVARDTDPADAPPAIAARNWLFFRDGAERADSVGKLLKTLDTDPAWAAMHTRLLVRAVEWDESGRRPSYALRGEDLEAAEQWLTDADPRKDPQPTQLHTEYVITSRAAATRSQRIRNTVLTVGLVVALGLAALALMQRGRAEHEADLARSRELAAESLLTSQRDPQQALSRAVAAAEVDETAEAARALRLALEGTSPLQMVLSADEGLEDVEYSGDGSLLAAAGSDGTAFAWDPGSGEPVASLESGGGRVYDLDVDRDGGLIALAAGGRVELWRPGGERPLRVIGGPSDLTRGVAVTGDGRLVAGASSAGIVRVWRTADGRLSAVHTEPRGQVFSAQFDRTGERLVAGGENGRAYVWEAGAKAPVATFDVATAAHADRLDVNDAVFGHRGRLVVTASADGAARIWNVSTGELLNTVDASTDELRRAQLNPTGRRLLTAGFDGVARIWGPPPGGRPNVPAAITGPPITTLAGHDSDILGASLSPDGRRVATAGADGTVRVWDSEPDDAVREFGEHRYSLRQVEAAPEGTEVVSASADGTARIWDMRSGGPVATLRVGAPFVVDASWGADADAIVTASWNGKVKLFAVPSGKQLEVFRVPGGNFAPARATPHRADPTAARLTPDGSTVVTAVPDGRVISWNAETGKVEDVVDTTQPTSMDLSPDGSRVAIAATDGSIPVLDLATGQVATTLRGHRDVVASVEFSPDGDRLVSTSYDRTARIWDLGTGEGEQVLAGHAGEVYDAAFSLDGRLVVTGGADRTARVWDVATGDQLDVLNGNRYWVNGVDFAADGSLIVSGGTDRSGRVFECALCVPFDELLALARERLERLGSD